LEAGLNCAERNLIASIAPIELSTMFSIMSVDQATANTENDFEPKNLTDAKAVIIVRATIDSATPLAAAPTSMRGTDLMDFTYEPIIMTRSNTSPETNVEARRYGAGDGTANKNTTPQTAPIMVALHFLPVLRMTAVIRMPRKKCSGYPTCVMKETRPAETMYSAEKSPMIASAREEVTFGCKNNFSESVSNSHRLSLVLSVKNHTAICGNHNQSCDY
jgi:hypothetical protein